MYCEMGKDTFHARIVNNHSEEPHKAVFMGFVGQNR